MDCYAVRMRHLPVEEWPDTLILLGDQVYADELTPQVKESLESSRASTAGPSDEVVDFEEYEGLYRHTWGDPEIRWILSTVPTAMIFDDHDIRDDWNTSDTWRRQMSEKPWWQDRIRAGLASYWVYQHLGNLSPTELDSDDNYQKVLAADGDCWPLLAELADRADSEVDGDKGLRFSFRWDLGRSRLVMVDSRNARILDGGERKMLGDREFAWVEKQVSDLSGVDHLIIGSSLPWLLPLLYVMLALSLVAWAGLRHSNRTRRGRALFVFTVGIVLIVAALAFFLLRAVGTSGLVGVGAAATLLGCAMLIVATGSLLPSLEDWFGARRELRIIGPILTELGRRHPDVGIGVRPRGPLVFRVAERMSLISDALFLEATAAAGARRRVDAGSGGTDVVDPDPHGELADLAELKAPDVTPVEQASAIAAWIAEQQDFPGLSWLRQPATYSDREWILEIARQYRAVDSGGSDGGLRRSGPPL